MGYKIVTSLGVEGGSSGEVGGNTGIPLGPVYGWSGLDALSPEGGSFAIVFDIDEAGSYGLAGYGFSWELIIGYFPTATEMYAFNYGLNTSTIANVGSGVGSGDPDDLIKYVWNGASWVRAPNGIGYIHFPVANITELLAISDPKETDRALVYNTGYGTYGWAEFAGGDWYLDKGAFPTVANMQAFLTDASIDPKDAAIAIVPTGIAGTDADQIYYVYSEADLEWQRTPLDTHYIWPQVNNWASLLSTRAYGQASDEVHVHSLGTAHSSGTAQMHGSEWRLIEGKWTSVTNMNNWANAPSGQIVHEGAIGLVDAAHHYDEDSSAYYYTGSAWVPFVAAGVTKVHSITSVFDFSASGLADGDYGVLMPPNGSPIVLRYKAACTIAAGGTRAVWMTPTAYAGSPVLYAWTNGTENNATLTSQGWTLAIGTGCSLTPTAGYQRLVTPGAQVSVSLTAMSGAISAATKVESIYECRGSIPGGTTVRSIQFYLADGTNGYSIGDSGQGGANGYGYRQSGVNAVVNTPIRDVTNVRIPALAANPFVCVARDEGRTVFTSVSVNGNAFADYRRNLGSIAASVFYVYVTGDITAPITMDYRGQVLTY